MKKIYCIYAILVGLAITACTTQPPYSWATTETYYVNDTDSDIKVKFFVYDHATESYFEKQSVLILPRQTELIGKVFIEHNAIEPMYGDYSAMDSVVVEKDGKYLYGVVGLGTLPRKIVDRDSYESFKKEYGYYLIFYHFYEEDFANAVAVGE